MIYLDRLGRTSVRTAYGLMLLAAFCGISLGAGRGDAKRGPAA